MVEMEQQSTFRTAVLQRYPGAYISGEGPYAVIMNCGKIHAVLFRTRDEAVRYAAGSFRIEYFGPKLEPQKPRWWDKDDD